MADTNNVLHEKKAFTDVDYSEKKLSNRELVGCVFDKCNFAKSDLSYNDFMDCKFKDCNFSMIKLKVQELAMQYLRAAKL